VSYVHAGGNRNSSPRKPARLGQRQIPVRPVLTAMAKERLPMRPFQQQNCLAIMAKRQSICAATLFLPSGSGSRTLKVKTSRVSTHRMLKAAGVTAPGEIRRLSPPAAIRRRPSTVDIARHPRAKTLSSQHRNVSVHRPGSGGARKENAVSACFRDRIRRTSLATNSSPRPFMPLWPWPVCSSCPGNQPLISQP